MCYSIGKETVIQIRVQEIRYRGIWVRTQPHWSVGFYMNLHPKTVSVLLDSVSVCLLFSENTCEIKIITKFFENETFLSFIQETQ